MAEYRVPMETWSINARLEGKKPLKIDIFLAHKWFHNWQPGSRNFKPRPPINPYARNEYWFSRFRVRINGKWYQNGARFTMLTREQIINLFLKE